jgi:hypothetical protein
VITESDSDIIGCRKADKDSETAMVMQVKGEKKALKEVQWTGEMRTLIWKQREAVIEAQRADEV